MRVEVECTNDYFAIELNSDETRVNITLTTAGGDTLKQMTPEDARAFGEALIDAANSCTEDN